MHWVYRDYGRITDPIHKSHLNGLTGDYACPKRFHFDRNTDYKARDEQRRYARTALGTAVHEVIAGILSRLISPTDSLKELLRELGPLETIEWGDDDPDSLINERAAMVDGLIVAARGRMKRVLAVEPGFIAPFGDYWIAGHVDVVYEPVSAPGTVAIADWKTGQQKPHPLALDHGWEAGIYSAALTHGLFIERGQRSQRDLDAMLIEEARTHGSNLPVTFGAFPSAIHHVHLADYIPYKKASSRYVHRVEDLAWLGLDAPATVKSKPGEQRGGAWCPVRLTEHDLVRLDSRLRMVVGLVRLGRFFDRPGEMCTRCPHREPCLNAGYEARGSERSELLDLYKDHDNA